MTLVQTPPSHRRCLVHCGPRCTCERRMTPLQSAACWFVKTQAEAMGGGRENERRAADKVRTSWFIPEVKSSD